MRVVVLKGKPYEIGFEHGTILRKEILEAQDFLKKTIKEFFDWKGGIVYLLLSWFVRLHASFYVPKEYKKEIEGVAKGSGVAQRHIYFLNYTNDIFQQNFLLKLISLVTFGCSAFVKKEKEGLIFGRNLDYVYPDLLSKTLILFVYQPEEGLPFLSFSWPGVIGASTAVNKNGLILSLNSSPSSDTTILGIPEIIRLRRTIQYSSSWQEALRYLITVKRMIGENIVLISQDNFFVAELSTKRDALRFPENNTLIITNHFEKIEMKRWQVPADSLNKVWKILNLPEEEDYLVYSEKRARALEKSLQKSISSAKDALAILSQPILISSGENVFNLVILPSGEMTVAKRDGQVHKLNLEELFDRIGISIN